MVEPEAVTRRREQIAPYRSYQEPERAGIASEKEIASTRRKIELLKRQVKEEPETSRYKVGERTLTREQYQEYLDSREGVLRRYESQKTRIETYLSDLRNAGFEAYITKAGDVVINAPEGMSELEATRYKIKFYPGNRILTKEGQVLRKDVALARIEEAIEYERIEGELRDKAVIDWEGDLIKEFADFFDYIKTSVGTFIYSPTGMGGTYLAELALYSGGLLVASSPDLSRKLRRWQTDLTDQRFEMQSGIVKSFEDALESAQRGNYSKLIEFSKQPIIEWGAIAATAYIGSATTGAITGYAEGSLGATISVAGRSIATKTAVNAAMITTAGGLVSYEIYQNINLIYKTEEKIKEVYNNYQKKIDQAKNEAQKEYLDKQRKEEIGELRKERARYATNIASIGVFLILSGAIAKYGGGERAYRFGYERGYQLGWTKSRFGLFSPKGRMARQTFKGIRALEKGTIKQYKPLKATLKTSEVKTAKILKYAAKKEAMVTGSGATYTQVPKGRYPKDIDLYMHKFSQVKPAQQKLGAGVDIHGGPGYYPGSRPAHIRLGIFQQKPVSFGETQIITKYYKVPVTKTLGKYEFYHGTTRTKLVLKKGLIPSKGKSIEGVTWLTKDYEYSRLFGKTLKVKLTAQQMKGVKEYAPGGENVGLEFITKQKIPSYQITRMQKPSFVTRKYITKTSPLKYQPITEQIPRKGTTMLQLMAGEEPKLGRVKDIGDFWSYSRQQISTLKQYGTKADYARAIRAEYHLGKAEKMFYDIYGKPPYKFVGGKLAPGGKTKILPAIGKPIKPPIIEQPPGAVAYPSAQKISAYPISYPVSQRVTLTYYPTVRKKPTYPKVTYKPTREIKPPTVTYPPIIPQKPKKPTYPETTTIITKTILYKTVGKVTETTERKKETKKKQPSTEEKRKLKEVPGYHGYAKEKGKWVRVTKQPLPKFSALGKSADVAENTPSRSIKIEKAKEPAIEDNTWAPTWTNLKDQFRKPVRKGTQQVDSPIYIEKSKYAINTRGEIKGITVKGWMAHQAKIKPPMKPRSPKAQKQPKKSRKRTEREKTTQPKGNSLYKPPTISIGFKTNSKGNMFKPQVVMKI